MSVQVRPVRVDDEPESQARRTRTQAVTLRAGELIDVEISGRWVRCVIEGQAHSEVRVRRVGRGPGHQLMPRTEQD